jgi:hypothetical protein
MQKEKMGKFGFKTRSRVTDSAPRAFPTASQKQPDATTRKDILKAVFACLVFIVIAVTGVYLGSRLAKK